MLAENITDYSFDELLAWVNSEADDQCPHILSVSLHQRGGRRESFLHRSARDARGHMMMMHCFDPDLIKFESLCPENS